MKIEKKIFSSMLSQMTVEKRKIAESLIDNVIFMHKTLSDLSEHIEEEGSIILRKNGNNIESLSENPALKSYNNTIRNFSTTCRTLLQYLPDSAEDDEFLDFISGKIPIKK